MDRYACMNSFVKVVELSGFSAAARRLNMSTSMVTTQVKSLEERLGVRLLNRTTRQVSVTEVGQAYYERCIHILSDIDDADNIAAALQSKPRGTLRLNLAPPLPRVLAPCIAEYTALHPDASIHITMTSRIVDLVEEGFDIAIRVTSIPDSSLIARQLATYRFVVCGAPEYFAQHGEPRTLADLAGHNCMSFSDAPWGADWPFFGPDNERSIETTGNFQSNSAETLRYAAVLGQGLIYVPSFLVAEELNSGRLVATLTDIAPTELPITAIYPHRQHLSAKVRTFIDLVAKHFRDAKWADTNGTH
jgi:DNA-binding transcriptional LysR family regulator